MSGYQWAAQTGVEPVSAADAGQWGNQALYSVISGCGLAYSAADMTVDLAVGFSNFFGAAVAVPVAAAGFTLVSDPSNPRWTWLCVSSTGTPVVVSGTPSATPAVPSYGDRVPLALVLVQAGLTIASNASYKIDKRIPATGIRLVAVYNTPTSTTSTVAVDLITLSGLSIPTTSAVEIWMNWAKAATSAEYVSYGFKANTTVVIEADTGKSIASSATMQAEDGMAVISIAPRAANYLDGVSVYGAGHASATGTASGQAIPNTPGAVTMANPMPNATITSLAIRALNHTTTNAAAVSSVQVWVRG